MNDSFSQFPFQDVIRACAGGAARLDRRDGRPPCGCASSRECAMAYAPFDLKGKVALVTGGNSGIGLGMADAMAQAGADIVIWGTNAAKNQAAEGQLLQHG